MFLNRLVKAFRATAAAACRVGGQLTRALSGTWLQTPVTFGSHPDVPLVDGDPRAPTADRRPYYGSALTPSAHTVRRHHHSKTRIDTTQRRED